jgi:hypothetical protein
LHVFALVAMKLVNIRIALTADLFSLLILQETDFIFVNDKVKIKVKSNLEHTTEVQSSKKSTDVLFL